MTSKFLRGTTAVVATVTMVFGSTAASAATCQAGSAGCLLPLAAPPAPAAPVEAAPVAATETATGGGIGALAILAGLAVAGLIAYLVIDGDNDEADSN